MEGYIVNYLISGGTGFIGKQIARSLNNQGHHTYILTRSIKNKVNTANTSYISYDDPAEKLPPIEGVINLAGESLFGYWSANKKNEIMASRLAATNHVIELVNNMKTKPSVFINGSAVGYYGMTEDLIFTEKTAKPGNDFLANVVMNWEQTAKQIESMRIRTIYARFGVVLGKEGALPLMALPVKLFAGGKIGTGEQWISWIHINDVVNLMQFCLFNKQIEGPVNFTAPNPKRNKEFMQKLAEVLNRPNWIHTPSTIINIAIGEMGQLITKGQYVLPKNATNHGYEFHYPELIDALNHLYKN